MTQNQLAFLAMIAHSEGTDRANDPYRVCYGFSHTIIDLSYHPAEHRPPAGAVEWAGESIANLGAQYAGEVSTAAGRYQMRLATWLGCKKTLNLSGFTPDAQNDAGVLLIKQRGALVLVNANQIQEAIIACKEEWASLPGGDSNQPEHTFAYLIDFYTQAGGVAA
jgi:muramidase (phage lysozyme)